MKAPFSHRIRQLFSDPNVHMQFERKLHEAKLGADGWYTVTIEHEGESTELRLPGPGVLQS
jgi:hypothetical protein